MRVALIIRNYYPDTPRFDRMAHALAERGTEVLVVCLRRDESEARVERQDGIEIVRLRHAKRRGSRLRYVAEYGAFLASALGVIQRQIARRRFDLVQVASPPDVLVACACRPGSAARRWCSTSTTSRRSCTPRSSTTAGPGRRAPTSWRRWSAPRSPRAVTCSAPGRSFARR